MYLILLSKKIGWKCGAATILYLISPNEIHLLIWYVCNCQCNCIPRQSNVIKAYTGVRCGYIWALFTLMNVSQVVGLHALWCFGFYVSTIVYCIWFDQPKSKLTQWLLYGNIMLLLFPDSTLHNIALTTVPNELRFLNEVRVSIECLWWATCGYCIISTINNWTKRFK